MSAQWSLSFATTETLELLRNDVSFAVAFCCFDCCEINNLRNLVAGAEKAWLPQSFLTIIMFPKPTSSERKCTHKPMEKWNESSNASFGKWTSHIAHSSPKVMGALLLGLNGSPHLLWVWTLHWIIWDWYLNTAPFHDTSKWTIWFLLRHHVILRICL